MGLRYNWLLILLGCLGHREKLRFTNIGSLLISLPYCLSFNYLSFKPVFCINQLFYLGALEGCISTSQVYGMLDRQVIVSLICLLSLPGRWGCSWQSIQFQWLWHGSLSPSQRRRSSQGYSTKPTSSTTKGFRFHQKEVCWPCKKDWYNIPCCIPTRLPHFQHLLLDYIQNYTAWGHSQEVGNWCARICQPKWTTCK